MPNGQGKLICPNEALYYEGTFIPNDEQFEIRGRIVYDDGRVEEGQWGNVMTN